MVGKKVNNAVNSNTNDCTLKWFQYRILHRILGTNTLLFKIGISDTIMCSFCHSFPETISHMFYFCSYSQQLWLDLNIWLHDICSIDINLNVKSIIFGIANDNNRNINIIINLVKKYILDKKLKNAIPL